MIEMILEKMLRYFYLPRLNVLEHEIGYKLVFHNIPADYINGWVSCDMTKTWQKSGLEIEKGANYFTVGHVLHNESSRFDPNSLEYQSWLGGYTLKLKSPQSWTIEEHFKLAIADQNSWLKWYGNPRPTTRTDGWNFTDAGRIQVGQYSGNLYEGGCTTFSDVGIGYKSIKLRLVSVWLAALFNLSNPNLNMSGNELRPQMISKSYEGLNLHGYIAILDLPENVKVVLYGNGFINKTKHADTFMALKNSFLNSMKSWDIKSV